MMLIRHKKLVIFLVIILLIAPFFCWAVESGSTVNIPNPLGERTDPRELVGLIIGAILGIVGSLALVVFILGGFTWMTSGGNPDRVKRGKDMIIWATLGLAVIFFAYSILRFILTSIKPGDSGTDTRPLPSDEATTK